MIVIYSRFHCIEQNDDHETLEDAIRCLEYIHEYGHGYALGVYDPETKTVHIPENMNIADIGREKVLEQKRSTFERLGLEIEKIEFYDRS